MDTDRGTLEGVPRLAGLFERLDVRATFLFSLGPDQTGRAVKRAFRRGFMGKVRRTSVLKHYGLKTLAVWNAAARSAYRAAPRIGHA